MMVKRSVCEEIMEGSLTAGRAPPERENDVPSRAGESIPEITSLRKTTTSSKTATKECERG